MHPEMSLVVLTVLTATGQGLFILTVLFDALFLTTGTVPSGFITTGTIFALFFQFIGMGASFFHLGNAQKGWKAILKWKNSWLTREIITLSAFVGLAFLYLIFHAAGATDSHRLFVGALALIAGIGFLISSSMVYASISFIREWGNIFTPLNFIMLGITSGVAVGNFFLYLFVSEHEVSGLIKSVTGVLILLGIISFFVKYLTNRYISNAYVSVGVKNAVGINDPVIQLTDMGTSYSHYNTKEYYFYIPKNKLNIMRMIVYVTVFVIPLLIWAYTFSHPNGFLNFIAVIFMIRGIGLDRWLFFVQGNHIQNLYYDNFRKSNVKNPLLSEATKGAPVPH
jgi:DMSO reductase anchor subunit